MALFLTKGHKRRDFMLIGIVIFLLMQSIFGIFTIILNMSQNFLSFLSTYTTQFLKFDISSLNNNLNLNNINLAHIDVKFFELISAYAEMLFSFVSIGLICCLAFFIIVKAIIFVDKTTSKIAQKTKISRNALVPIFIIFSFEKPNMKMTA